MMENPGILADQRRRNENLAKIAADPTLLLCLNCDGTGNEFYSMYRACPECGGSGLVEE